MHRQSRHYRARGVSDSAIKSRPVVRYKALTCWRPEGSSGSTERRGMSIIKLLREFDSNSSRVCTLLTVSISVISSLGNGDKRQQRSVLIFQDILHDLLRQSTFFHGVRYRISHGRIAMLGIHSDSSLRLHMHPAHT
ncbi:hypothetical protein KC351_g86 [Hortaea werneckii]|nr:hypothetical protein KC351_g86 [Hortaea werneckii]